MNLSLSRRRRWPVWLLLVAERMLAASEARGGAFAGGV